MAELVCLVQDYVDKMQRLEQIQRQANLDHLRTLDDNDKVKWLHRVRAAIVRATL